MPRLIFCRREDCAEAYVSVAGKIPAICPACDRPAQWTTIPPMRIVAVYADPLKPYDLSDGDVLFLKTNRIDPERANDSG